MHMGKEIKLANERRFESEMHQRSVLETASSLREALRGRVTKTEVRSLTAYTGRVFFTKLLPLTRRILFFKSCDIRLGF